MSEPEPEPASEDAATRRRTERLRRYALPMMVFSIVALVIGAYLVSDCVPLSSPNAPLCPSGNISCFNPGVCPYGADGVIVIVAASLVLAVGIALFWGRRPEGEEPHPEPKARKSPDTVLTRMEQEKRDRELERERESE